MKILVIAPAWVGDMMIAQVLFKQIKQCHPEVIIDVIASPWVLPLLAYMPEVNTALPLPIQHGEFGLLKRYQIAKALRTQQYTHAIILANSWKSALIPFLARIPVRIGWLGEMRFGLLTKIYFLTKKNQQKYVSLAERFLRLWEKSCLSSALYPALSLSQNRQNRQKKNTLEKNILVLCPGAEFGPSKRWPVEYYASVANYFIAEKNMAIWLLGSQKDQSVTEKINQLTQHQCTDFAGKTTLSEAIERLAQATWVVSNDSGLMHIATALQKPVVALYGSTDPRFTPPLSSNNTATVLFISANLLTCRPCFQRTCPLVHHKCMQDLLPTQVISAICAF